MNLLNLRDRQIFWDLGQDYGLLCRKSCYYLLEKKEDFKLGLEIELYRNCNENKSL